MNTLVDPADPSMTAMKPIGFLITFKKTKFNGECKLLPQEGTQKRETCRKKRRLNAKERIRQPHSVSVLSPLPVVVEKQHSHPLPFFSME